MNLEREKTLADILNTNGEGLLKTQFFQILVQKQYEPVDIQTVWENTELRYPNVIQERIEKNWESVLARSPKAFPGPLVSLRKFNADNDRLILHLGPTNYKDYSGTKSLTDEEKRMLDHKLPNPLAIVTIVSTSIEGRTHLLFGIRSNELAHHPGALEIPGGNVDIDNNGKIDPVMSAIKELHDEQGILPEMIQNIKVLGMAYEYYQDAAPVIIMNAELDQSVSHNDLSDNKKDDEATTLWIPDNLDVLEDVLTNYMLISLPVVQAGIYLYLVNNYQGEVVSRNIVDKILSASKQYAAMDTSTLERARSEQRKNFSEKYLNNTQA